MLRFVPSTILVVLLATLRAGAFQVNKPQPANGATRLNAISRRDVFSLVPTMTTTVATTAVLGLAAPLEARAAEKKKTEPKNQPVASFQGVFRDPKHPKGYRILVGSGKGTMTLQDDPAGDVIRAPFRVRTDKKSKAVTLTMDFRPKGGPKDVEAVLGTKGSGKNAVATLTFPDGNVWTKETGLAGVYRDGLNPKYMWVIRKSKGSNLSVDLINGSKTTTIAATAGSPNVTFDFPGKAGDVGTVDKVKNTISFADGNVWTKL